MNTYLTLVLCLIYIGCGTPAWGAEDPVFVPPADSRVINVRDHGALGDGKQDDSDAIMAAIVAAYDRDNRYAAPPMVYFPAGTYRVTRSIEARRGTTGWSSGWLAGCLLVGERRSTTIIRLDDAAEGFGDVEKPKWLLATGSESDGPNKRNGGGNRAFRHAIMNFTIDVGADNPGATAVDFIVSNRGTLENCDLRAEKGSGYCGIRMDREWPGPGLISRVRISGFAYGVRMDHHAQYSMTFEDITLEGQRTCGFIAKSNPIFIRRLTAKTTVPVFRIGSDRHLLVLTDSELDGAPSATGAAIESNGNILIRNLRTRGWATVIDDRSKADGDMLNDKPAAWKTISDHRQGPQGSATSAEPAPLRLPVEETPRFFPTASTRWANGGDGLQAAIDSGAEIVYLPNGHHPLTETLIVRGNVRKIIGFQSSIGMPKDNPLAPMIRIENTKQPVIFEHLWLSGPIDHAGSGSVVFSHCDLGNGLHCTGTGKTFLEDVIGKYVIEKGHRLWARQTNAEFGKEPLLVNNGGSMWLFGFKTEGEMPVLMNNGGDVEVLGGLFYALRKVPADNPLIINDGGRMALSWVYNGNNYGLHVRGRIDAQAEWREDRGSYARGPVLWSTETP